MGKGASPKNLKESNSKKVPAKKLDFLLDTIDTEVADLADVVEVPSSIVDEATAKKMTETMSLNDATAAEDSLELELDLFEEVAEPAVETKSADNRAQAALDAMSEAEDEIEAMLAEVGSVPEDIEPTGGEAINDSEMGLAQALEELLATREVDASKLIEKTAERRAEHQRAKSKAQHVEAEKGAKDDQLSDDLSHDIFEDLDSEVELEREDLGNKKKAAVEEGISPEPLDELAMDFEFDKEDETVAEKDVFESGLAQELLEAAELQRLGKENQESDSEPAASATSSDQQLAELLSHKIEALVIKVVEERLAEIAERVIKDRINKIFSSLK
jgi:hypothetical protein